MEINNKTIDISSIGAPLILGFSFFFLADGNIVKIIYNFLPSGVAIPIDITRTISIALFTITIPLFTFAITLLGNAIEKAKIEETKKEKDFLDKKNERIKQIQKASQQLKEGEEAYNKLLEETKKIEKERDELNKSISKIKNKYSYLSFKKSVLYPDVFFIYAIFLNEYAFFFKTSNPYLSLLFCLISIFYLSAGSWLLYKCLSLIEEISATSDEFQNKKLKDALCQALAEDKKIEIVLDFPSTKFPYKGKIGKQIVIPFKVSMTKGYVAKNVRIWFNVPNSFEVIDLKKDSAPQYKIEIGDLICVREWTQKFIKIIPLKKGTYTIDHTLSAEGYSGGWEHQIEIIVQS